MRYLLFFLWAGVVSGCSPGTGKKALTFFFDGVPQDTASAVNTADNTPGRADTTLTARIDPHKTEKNYHVPFTEKQCDLCHDQRSMGQYVEPQPALCYQCHEDFSDVYKVLHGPVAGGYCTACHNPHFSRAENLLTRTGRDLCLYCHVPGESFDRSLHEGLEDTQCTECHNPHGGESRELMN